MDATLFEAWLDTYRAAGRSPETIRTRRSYLTTLSREHDPLTLSSDDLTAFLASRTRLAAETRKGLVVTLRSFYRWAYQRGLVDSDLAVGLPSVTVPKGVPRPISELALRQARAAADVETRLMLDLGARAGLRRSEISRVHESDVTDLGLVVVGKGSRQRLIPIHPRLDTRLRQLRGWAFPSPLRPGPVTGDYIATRLERVLPDPWTAHSLRHYFASTAYAGTHDLRAVQALLGHASIETTERYVAVAADSLTAAVRAVA